MVGGGSLNLFVILLQSVVQTYQTLCEFKENESES